MQPPPLPWNRPRQGLPPITSERVDRLMEEAGFFDALHGRPRPDGVHPENRDYVRGQRRAEPIRSAIAHDEAAERTRNRGGPPPPSEE